MVSGFERELASFCQYNETMSEHMSLSGHFFKWSGDRVLTQTGVVSSAVFLYCMDHEHPLSR